MHCRLDSSRFDIILAERHPGSLQLSSWTMRCYLHLRLQTNRTKASPISNSQQLHQEVKLWSSATTSSIVRQSAGLAARHLCRIAHNSGLMSLGLTRHSWPCRPISLTTCSRVRNFGRSEKGSFPENIWWNCWESGIDFGTERKKQLTAHAVMAKE